MTVLVVDDEPVALRLLSMMLERQHFLVERATSAEDALTWLERPHPVELVITDQNLGGMSGLELFSRMQADLRWADIPVILCTGAADRATVTEALRRGLRWFLVKPITADALLDKVKQAQSDLHPVMEPRYECMTRLGLNEVEYRGMARSVRERLSGLATLLAVARESGNYAEARHLALQVMEPARLVGAPRLVQAAYRLSRLDGDAAIPVIGVVAQEIALLDEAVGVALRPSLFDPLA
jgi:twitching motility two-component system response regulator PilH